MSSHEYRAYLDRWRRRHPGEDPTKREPDEWIRERIAAGSEGSEPCQGEYCEGLGLVEEAGDHCGWCREIDYGIWKAGEPD